MNRDEALKLLTGGREGVGKWNRWGESKTDIDPLPNLSRGNLRWADLHEADLREADLREADLREADLRGTNLREADLREANLRKADLRKADLREADLRKADLRGTNLREADLRKGDLHKTDLRGTNLRGTNLSGADLSEADLSETNLSGANLTGMNLSRADLSGADLSGADLNGADLSGAHLSGAHLSETNLNGANLNGADLNGADLSGANLSGADLSETHLGGANLSGADLSGANLFGANLNGANLNGADLNGADLNGADLRKADLSGADLSGADLSEANLTLTRLIRANLANAVIENAIVQDTHVHELRGLPTPAIILRFGLEEPYEQLLGSGAANFFMLPAVVEVFLTRTLTNVELGCLHFHEGDVHGNRVATDVYFIGPRHEAGGSVLQFQGPTYDAVYAALPDLLAAFRTSEAIDWKQTLGVIPGDERGEAITAVMKTESRLKTGRWRLAARLADAFEGFADARVVKLLEGRKKGVIITVFSDETMLERLARAVLPSGPTSAALVFQGPSTHYHGDTQTGDTFNISGTVTGAALGRAASVTAEQIVAGIRQLAAQPANVDLIAAVKKALDQIASANETAWTAGGVREGAESRARPGT